jgi:DNA polymerase I
MPKKLYLLDAYALIFRAYYAFIKAPRITSKGLNTSAIFGFINALLDIIKKEKPTHLAVVFDPPSPTFRNEIYPEYKANRDETPEDIRLSVPYIKDILKAFKIPVIQVDGFEADDVVGTIAKIAEKKDFITFMVTSDKDYCQLVSDKIFMYRPRRQENEIEIIGINEVKQKFNIQSPEQFIDILALMGDASDNIPGAKGIGEKTALKLISEFGTVENLFVHIDEIQGRLKENIINSTEMIKLSKVLATINTEVPVEFDEARLLLDPPDKDGIFKIFEELEFKNLALRVHQIYDNQQDKTGNLFTQKQQFTQGSLFDNADPVNVQNETESHQTKFENINTVAHNYHLVDSDEKIRSLKNELSKLKEFCFDTETTGIDPMNVEIVGLSFSFKSHEAYYIPFPPDQNKTQNILNEFKPVFENENIKKTGQNLKYDIITLSNYNIKVKGELFDTMLAHYLIQPELRHNLNYLSETFLNYQPVPIEDLIGKKGKNQLNMRDVPVGKICEYSCEDADLTWQLKEILEKEISLARLGNLLFNIETPLIYVLTDMEKTGVKINIEELKKYGEILEKEALETENEIYKIAGMNFNISSPKQLGEVLFDRLKIMNDAKKTKTQQYSTGEEILEKLAGKHEIINKILDYRSIKKLLSTYIDALPQLINPKTGKIHTSYNQAIVATGRLSSNNPNLQNIPIREERGRRIRRSFIPSDEQHTFISADYSQIELRLMAHFSEDPHLIQAFANNEDIHTATAAKIFKLKLSEVTKDMRSTAKTANFGIIYGISAFGLSQRLNISRTDAKNLIDNYFLNYPDVKKYMDSSIDFARKNGYVETLFGRKRFLPDINSRNAMVRGMAERNAINAPLQGTAADIIKVAMLNIFNRLNNNNLRSKMIMQVHDELIFDCYIPETEELTEIIRNEMQNAAKLKVPLIVDIGRGDNWAEAH